MEQNTIGEELLKLLNKDQFHEEEFLQIINSTNNYLEQFEGIYYFYRNISKEVLNSNVMLKNIIVKKTFNIISLSNKIDNSNLVFEKALFAIEEIIKKIDSVNIDESFNKNINKIIEQIFYKLSSTVNKIKCIIDLIDINKKVNITLEIKKYFVTTIINFIKNLDVSGISSNDRNYFITIMEAFDDRKELDKSLQNNLKNLKKLQQPVQQLVQQFIQQIRQQPIQKVEQKLTLKLTAQSTENQVVPMQNLDQIQELKKNKVNLMQKLKEMQKLKLIQKLEDLKEIQKLEQMQELEKMQELKEIQELEVKIINFKNVLQTLIQENIFDKQQFKIAMNQINNDLIKIKEIYNFCDKSRIDLSIDSYTNFVKEIIIEINKIIETNKTIDIFKYKDIASYSIKILRTFIEKIYFSEKNQAIAKNIKNTIIKIFENVYFSDIKEDCLKVLVDLTKEKTIKLEIKENDIIAIVNTINKRTSLAMIKNIENCFKSIIKFCDGNTKEKIYNSNIITGKQK